MSNSAKCSNCRKTQKELPIPLKRCAQCKNQWYCSRECQKTDWKRHKKVCSSTFGKPKSTSTRKATSRLVCFNPNPLKALNDGTWLHNRPKNDVFKLLVDTYRIKMEEQYVFEGDVEEGSIYAGAGPESALRHFRNFLVRIINAERSKKLLPVWWSKDSFKECLQFARNDKFSNVGFPLKKNDIQEHYSQMDMPIQLSMFAEKIDESLDDDSDDTSEDTFEDTFEDTSEDEMY